MDFDPVLGGQDPCPRNEPSAVDSNGPPYRVHIAATCDRAAGPVPGVIAEVVPRGAGFVFVNFRYPSSNTDLRTTLAQLRGDRVRK